MEESTYAMSQIFPPDQFLGNAHHILSEANMPGLNQEMESLVNKFTQGPSQKFMSKASEQYINRKRTDGAGYNPRLRSNSKDRRLKDIDRINVEVEKKLKLQRKAEKERIKKYGQIYGPNNLFGTGQKPPNVGNSSQHASSKRPRSISRERSKMKSSQQQRSRKNITSTEKNVTRLNNQASKQNIKRYDFTEETGQNLYGIEDGHMALPQQQMVDASGNFEQLSINIKTEHRESLDGGPSQSQMEEEKY